GEHDDRNLAVEADLADHLGAWLPGQHQVQQHQVGAVAFELGHGLEPVVGDPNFEPLAFQQVGQRVRERFLVLNDQYAGHRRPPSRSEVEPSIVRSFIFGPAGTLLVAGSSSARGSLMVNVDPWPGCDQSDTSPPWLASTCLTMLSPNPV